MKRKTNRKGFSLIELMTVVAIVAVLVALALPSYTRYVLKANRGEAQQLMLGWTNNLEIWRANSSSYDSEISGVLMVPLPTHDKYDFSIVFTCVDNSTNAASCYIITADPKGNQVKDKEGTVDCDPLTLSQSANKEPPECW